VGGKSEALAARRGRAGQNTDKKEKRKGKGPFLKGKLRFCTDVPAGKKERGTIV